MSKKKKKCEVFYTPEFMKSLKKFTGLRYRIFSYLPDKCRNLKYRIQRFKRGYSDQDAWSIDYFLADILPKMLKQLRKNNHGCPNNLYDKKNKKNECHKWDKILLEMEEGFKAARSINDLDYYELGEDVANKRKEKELYNKFNKGMSLFVKYFFSLWD